MESDCCPKCKSSTWISDVRLIETDRGRRRELDVVVHKKPDNWLFKGTVTTQFNARVCSECGFTELYAIEPKLLR